MDSLIEKAIALRNVHLFENLSADALRLMAGACEELPIRAGEIILDEGESSTALYIIVSGSVRVLRDHGKKTEERLAILGAGEYFGEMNLFDGEPHSATIAAAEDCRLYRISQDPLREIIDLHPALSLEILRGFSLRMRRMNLKS